MMACLQLASARQAIPIIAAAKNAEITIIDPPLPGATALIRVDVWPHCCRALARGPMLLSCRGSSLHRKPSFDRAKEKAQIYMVMGAYGHSPMRRQSWGGDARYAERDPYARFHGASIRVGACLDLERFSIRDKDAALVL